MAKIEIWYDKPAEVDPVNSWAALCPLLAGVPRNPLDFAPYPAVLGLMEYARPDVVITADGDPFLVMELTQMNPSGHNLPQRFSCLVRAAELQVPALYYYLEYARRSASDPNPRYANIRVPLGQLQLSRSFGTPNLSIIWPTDPHTLQAATGLPAHQPLADFVNHAVALAHRGLRLNHTDPMASAQYVVMEGLIAKYYTSNYGANASYNSQIAWGTCNSEQISGKRISPPESCQLVDTSSLLKGEFFRLTGRRMIPANKKTAQLTSRPLSLVYKGTANKKGDGPEHPYPGYLTLIDILYARTPRGLVPRDRRHNLAFVLPIDLAVFKDKALDRQTGLNILMEFSDLVLLNDAVVVGGFLRNLSAGAVLI